MSNSTSELSSPINTFIREMNTLSNTSIPNAGISFTNNISPASSSIVDAGNSFNSSIATSYTDFTKNVLDAGVGFKNTINSISPIRVKVVVTERARGGIAGLQAGISETKGPMLAMIGEAGPEAVVPLQGKNKKFGERILNYIIPKYYPDIMLQRGGIFDVPPVREPIYEAGNNYEENYTVTGPVSVVSQDPIDFMRKIRNSYRASPGGK